MIVAIAGATGLTGSFCLQELLQNENISSVIAIGRKQTGIKHDKLKEVLLDNNKLSDIIKADAFICCLGTTIKKARTKEAFKSIDLELPVYLADKLINNGCNTVAVISSMGANPNSSIFYNKVKGQMEEAMKNINIKSFSILRPSIISGPRKEKRFGEKMGLIFITIFNPLLFGSLKHYKSIKAKDIAKALVHCVINQKTGTTIYLSGEIKELALF
ncbi:MAG: NAD-dependent epimerase/dehydratase family protein [Bacteroidia bacterium]|nr:NAD-dependent epimerase/dehydratase family protein [Bacteroidia bacterium]